MGVGVVVVVVVGGGGGGQEKTQDKYIEYFLNPKNASTLPMFS